MKTNENLSRWIFLGLLSIPLPVIVYFYLLLHLHFGIPLTQLILPASIFCAFIPLFAAGAYWGTRARSKGNSRLLFTVLGVFVLLCGFEFSYFEAKINPAASHKTSYGFTIVWAVIVTVGAFLLDRKKGSKAENGSQTSD